MDRKKILLVDDEPDFLDVIGQRIESWGHEVILAQNAKEAMDAFKNESPDVIILDYIMPDIDGVELLKKIRAIDRKIPVIMFTAKPEFDAIKDTEKLNILAFVPKLSPFTDTRANLKSTLDMAFKKMESENGK